jgi:hypothetical protein
MFNVSAFPLHFSASFIPHPFQKFLLRRIRSPPFQRTLAARMNNIVSEQKLAANRRNAQRSTGPKTQAGRAASKMNALKHSKGVNP